MKKTSSSGQSKDVIIGYKSNKESIYYTSLFGAAFLISLALLFVGIRQGNKGLIIYSAILLPLFIAATAISVRFIFMSKGNIYVENGALKVNTFFRTSSIRISDIDALKVKQLDDEGITVIKIKHNGNTSKFRFNKLSKDEVAHLRRATSKF